MISLARRITLGTVMLTVVVVGVSTILVWMIARWQAVRMLDGELDEHANRIAFMAGHRHGPPAGFDFQQLAEEWFKPEPMPIPIPPPLRADTGWIFVETVETDGRTLFRSPSLSDPAVSLAGALADAPSGVSVWTSLAGKKVRGRRVVAGTLTGYVARDATAALAELQRLALTLAAVWGTASLLALLAAWWLRRAVVGPLQRLSAGIRAIDPERLGGHVVVEAPQEVAETVQLLNDLLDRLTAVLAREKGTIASIAHELRSPISGLRTTLEVAMLEAGGRDQLLAARCLPTVVAMHTMVANLLALARLEAGLERAGLQEVDADAVLASACAILAPVAHGRGQRLECSGYAGPVRSCPDKAGMVLANLLDNAIAHAPPGSVVAVTSTRRDGRAWISIANPLSGPAPDLTHVFEPFWQGDEARSSPQHCGLGLTLAKRIADLIGAELRVEVTEGGFVAQLGLPPAA